MLSGKNGILNETIEAGERSEKSSINDQVKLAAMAALTAGNGKIEGEKAYKELNDGLIEAGYEGEEITSLPKTITINGTEYVIQKDGAVRETSDVEKKVGEVVKGTKAVLLDANNEQIVVPVGFKIQEGSPTEVKKGIVVEAKDGSEFVWVPVTDVTKMAKETDGNEDGTKNYEGILYDFKSDDGKYSAEPMKDYGQGSENNREPSLVTGSDEDNKAILEKIDGAEYDANEKYLNILEIDGATEFGKIMQKDYNKMIDSVAKNKGFYVGRYETSLDEDTKYAQSKLGGTITTTKDTDTKYWYGLYKVQKEYSEKNKITDSVGSSMIWGSQYDQMLIWMQESGIDVKKSTPVDAEGNLTVRNETNIAGNENDDKLNNIYDLCGKNTEITLEAGSVEDRVSRGAGPNVEKWGLDMRTYTGPGSASGVSSRLTLYVKEN